MSYLKNGCESERQFRLFVLGSLNGLEHEGRLHEVINGLKGDFVRKLARFL